YWALLMLCLGVITMVLGAILAVFSNNLKRTLACSSMSQIGFITIGIAMAIFLGEHNALAVRGTILHMVNHSLIKLLLFMIAGVIYTNTHQLDLNKVQGFGRKKWGLMILFLIGALGISGIPLFNGYISKTLLHESIVEYIELLHGTSYMVFFEGIEMIFLFAGGLTLAYMMKLFVCLFVEKNQDEALQAKYDGKKSIMSKESWFYLIVSAIPLLLIGLFANVTADQIADFTQSFMHGHSPEHVVEYFSFENLKGSIISILIGVSVYLVVIRGWLTKYENKSRVYLSKWPNWLDLEFLFYRPLLKYVLPFIFSFISRFIASLTDWSVGLLNLTILRRNKVLLSDQEDFKPGILIPQYKPHPRWAEVENSLSYGLMLFGLGVCVCMVYMLSIYF
ncbi:MAG: proton-conducting transporter membrane subunit, partial [Erysipelotrichaceae bacterium]